MPASHTSLNGAERRSERLATSAVSAFRPPRTSTPARAGVVVAREQRLIEICRSFHNQGRGQADTSFAYVRNGDNRRLTEFQGAILLAQLTRFDEQVRRREENAAYLTTLLRQIPGITPARMYEGVTRNAYHLYMFRYDPAAFRGSPAPASSRLSRPRASPAAAAIHRSTVSHSLRIRSIRRAYKYIYTARQLDDYRQRLNCPENDRLCAEAVWFTQTMFLEAARIWIRLPRRSGKIQKQSGELVKG
jgi:dTDP-4-amino-4,6-dideoxygalactose transaminase